MNITFCEAKNITAFCQGQKGEFPKENNFR
jgi:hypothetical protein